jgi:hypothetical protein
MCHRYGQPRLVREFLEFAFPKANTGTVAAAAIGCDQDLTGPLVTCLSEFEPPAADTFDGECRRVAGNAEIDPAGIGGNVIHAIRRYLAKLWNSEIMHPNGLGMTPRAQLTPVVLEVSNELLLFRVNRYGRLPGRLKRIDEHIDVLELRIAVRVARALTGLAVGLQAETQATQQTSNQFLARGEALFRQGRGKVSLTLAHP